MRAKAGVPEELAHELVKCPSCGRAFTVSDTAGVQPKPAEGGPPASKRPLEREENGEKRAPRDEDKPRPPSRPRAWEEEDDAADFEDDLGPRRDLEPDRGTLVLTIGIVGLVLSAVGVTGVCCAPIAILPLIGLILGTVGWVMGSKDLAAMREGRMDPRNQGTTKAGRTCSMIAVFLGILVIVLAVAWVLFFVLANRF